MLVTKFYSGDKTEENKILGGFGGGGLQYSFAYFSDPGLLPAVTVETLAVTL